MAVNPLARIFHLVLATTLLLSSLYEAAQILSMEAQDVEVLENEATELRCVVTLSNPDSELVTVTIEKVDTSELLSSTSNDSQKLSAVYEISSARKGDEGRYRCNATVGEAQMSATFLLTVIDHTPLYVVGNPDHYNSIDTSETFVVACDVKGVPQPLYKWEKDGQQIDSTPLNNETGPYVASNGSLLLDKAAPSDSGVYVCYGIDPLTGENATAYYIITVFDQGPSIWVSWYFFLIYAVVLLAIIIAVTVVCFFFVGTRDICIDLRKRRLKKETKRATAKRNSMLKKVPANPAYEINFSDEEEETSFMEDEEEYASSDEELVEKEAYRKEMVVERTRREARMVQSNVMPNSTEIRGSPQHPTAIEVDSSTSEDSDDTSLVTDSQPSSSPKQSQPNDKWKVSFNQKSYQRQEDSAMKPKGRRGKNQDPTIAQGMLY